MTQSTDGAQYWLVGNPAVALPGEAGVPDCPTPNISK
jgi:hypothetical protein